MAEDQPKDYYGYNPQPDQTVNMGLSLEQLHRLPPVRSSMTIQQIKNIAIQATGRAW